jgi:hypothetical protein
MPTYNIVVNILNTSTHGSDIFSNLIDFTWPVMPITDFSVLPSIVTCICHNGDLDAPAVITTVTASSPALTPVEGGSRRR